MCWYVLSVTALKKKDVSSPTAFTQLINLYLLVPFFSLQQLKEKMQSGKTIFMSIENQVGEINVWALIYLFIYF